VATEAAWLNGEKGKNYGKRKTLDMDRPSHEGTENNIPVTYRAEFVGKGTEHYGNFRIEYHL
jgi:hypothetical protein